MSAQPVPDFDAYDPKIRLKQAKCIDQGVELTWPDGSVSSFNRFTLRENDPSPSVTHPDTREQTLPVFDIPDDLSILAANVTDEGHLAVQWSTGESSEYFAGWLHAYSAGSGSEVHQIPERVVWDGSTMNDLPRFDGPEVLRDENRFYEWCQALHVYGFTVLENLPTDDVTLEQVATAIGPIRASNFGHTFEVRADAEQTSLAYTAMTLALHGDLCTREYMPGLQYLHCIDNSVDGGESQLSDGFHLARHIAATAPDHYRTLTTLPFSFYNKAVDSDFRWEAPVIQCDADGNPVEVRLSPWLRAPQRLNVSDVERCYQALRYMLKVAHDPQHHVQFKLKSGDLLAFDNRRLQHGRTGYDPLEGARRLRGCYGEREDLWSQIRIGQRKARMMGI